METCDACGWRATFVVTLSNGDKLTLCGHHTTQHTAALVASGASIAAIGNEEEALVGTS